MSGALLSLGVALVAVTATQAAAVSVDELLSNPDRFRGQPVTVSGTMSDFREHVTRMRTRYYTFDFGDGTQTVHVISYEKPRCQAGAARVGRQARRPPHRAPDEVRAGHQPEDGDGARAHDPVGAAAARESVD
jgi:hypothetical protein